MNKQKTFTDMEYAQRKRKGRREKFLDAPDAIIPWAAFEEKLNPLDVFPASPVQFGGRGQTFMADARWGSSCGRIIPGKTCLTRPLY
jgi:hypothetical protein